MEEQEKCGICVGNVEKGVIFNNFVLPIETMKIYHVAAWLVALEF
jgi:hypothetical protein